MPKMFDQEAKDRVGRLVEDRIFASAGHWVPLFRRRGTGRFRVYGTGVWPGGPAGG